LWLSFVDEDANREWQAFIGRELVGRLSLESSRLWVVPGQLIYIDQNSGLEQLNARSIVVSGDTVDPLVTVDEQALSVQLTIDTSNSALIGQTSISVLNSAGTLLPHVGTLNNDSWVVSIPLSALNSLDTEIQLQVETHASSRSISVAINSVLNAAVDAVNPTSSTILSQGARTPVVLTVADSARISDAAILDPASFAMGFAGGVGYQWLQLPKESSTSDYALFVNGAEQPNSPVGLLLQANDFESASVVIAQPVNNTRFREGDRVDVVYQTNNSDTDDFRYADISLFDFNNNLLGRVVAAEQNGRLSLRLPAIDQQDVLTLRVRTYFGDTLRYSESEVGIRVSPQFSVPEPLLTGVAGIAFAGGQASYSVAMRDEAEFQTRIEVFNDQAQLIAADDRNLEFIVPSDTSILRVVATAFDNFGNTREIEREVRVRLRSVPVVDNESRSFNAMLADVDQAWFTLGRNLINETGDVLASFESNITAIKRIGDRLLIGLTDNELLIIDPQENFQILSNHVIDGAATHFALRNQRLLAIIDGNLQAFTFRGNAIANAILRSRPDSDTATISDFIGDEPVLDITTSDIGFVVLQSDSLIHFDNNFITILEDRIGLEGAIAMAVHEEFIYVSRDNSSFHLFDSDGNEFVNNSFTLQIDAILPFGRQLIALSSEAQRFSFIDVTNPRDVQMVSQYPVVLASDVSNAEVFGGRLWLGGDNGVIVNIADGTDNGGVIFVASNTRGFSSDVAIDNGQIAVAVDSSGTVLYELSDGQWSDHSLDGPPTNLTAIDNGKIYISQRDNSRVVVADATQGVNNVLLGSSPVFTQLAAENLALTETMIIATQANQIHLALKDDITVTGIVEVEPGEDIISLAAHGETLYASTNNGRLYRIVPGNLPIDSFLVDISTIIDGSTNVIESLTVSGDYLFYRVDNDIFRLNLTTFQDQVTRIDGVTRVSAMVFGGDQVYVADIAGRIYTLDVATWLVIPEQTYDIGRTVTDMAYESGVLVLGLGNFGIQILEVGNAATTANPALLLPTSADIFVQGDVLTMSLTESALVNSVRYYIEDILIAGTSESPFTIETLVPPYLRNGQPFSIEAEIETIDGSVIRSQTRRALLQGQDLPGNAFTAVINTPRPDIPSFVPRPLEIRADVLNSSQPVFQVEFLESDLPDGEFRTIGRHFGPEFVIFRTFGLEDSGKYLRVRAVDEFGNVTESASVQVIRQEDTVLPAIGNFSIEGPTVGQNEIVAEHDFVISMPVQDLESGLESAILFRGDVIVAAIFNNGTVSFNETTAQANTDIIYRLVATDIAGNVTERSETYTIIEDVAPTISVSAIEPVIEQSQFTVVYQVQDLVEVSSVEVEWNGFVETQTFNQANTGQVRLPIRDRRAERLTSMISEDLIIRATDDIGQVSEQRIPVALIIDQVPDASALGVVIRANGFYANRELLTISNIAQTNDGSDPVVVELIEISPTDGALIQRIERALTVDADLVLSVTLPSAEIADNTYRFKVRITDHLGQQSETSEVAIVLTQLPNELRFFRSEDQTSFNPILVTVGSTVFYQVEVVDSANRRVANQQVEWTLTPIIAAGENGPAIDMGATISNAEGLTVLTLDTAQYVGLNTLTARLTTRPQIATQRRVRFDVGETVELRFASIAVSQAGETAVLSVTAHDVGGNPVTTDSLSEVEVRLPQAGFHFGFANGLQTALLPEGGEVAIFTLSNGRIDVPVTVASTSAIYMAPVAISGDNTNPDAVITYQFSSNQDSATQVSLLPIEVVANDPFAVRLELASVTNDILGDSERLETGEIVTVNATLIDQFFNRIDTLDPLGSPIDANLNLQLSVDGDGSFIGAGQTNSVALNQGIANFDVSNDTAETITVSVTATEPVLATVRDLGTLELEFLKRLPSITQLEFATAINSIITPLEFSYTEPVAIDANLQGQANVITLGAVTVPGVFVTNDNGDGTGTLVFTPQAQLELDRSYSTDSMGSTLRGVAANDEVLAQQLGARSHEALIDIPDNRFVLEGSNYPFTMQFADSVSIAGLLGNTEISRILNLDPIDITDSFQAPLNFASPSINIPTYSTAGLEDGQQILVTIIGSQPTDDVGLVFIVGIGGNEGGDGDSIGSVSVGGSLRTGNQLALTVLQRGADKDFDGDGLSNELEFATDSLDPANPDSDGDGINDGDDDLDNDGLSNRDEVANQTSLTNSDSDNDGVIDGDEVFIYGSNPLASDTDGDGISDFIEVSSDSDPTDEFDNFIDPNLVTAISATPTSLSAQLGSGSGEAQLEVIATFEFQGRIETTNITNLIDFVAYSSTDSSVATVSIAQPGLVTYVGAGAADIIVDFVENISLSQTVTVTVEAAPDTGGIELRIVVLDANPVQTLYRGADNGRVTFDIISGSDFIIEQALLDGQSIDVAVSDRFCRDRNDTNQCSGTTNYIHVETISGDAGINRIAERFAINATRYTLVMSQGVPLSFNGQLEILGRAGRDQLEAFSASTVLTIADDPEVAAVLTETTEVSLVEGLALALPVTITDSAFNNITVETLVDGVAASCGLTNYVETRLFSATSGSDFGGDIFDGSIRQPELSGFMGVAFLPTASGFGGFGQVPGRFVNSGYEVVYPSRDNLFSAIPDIRLQQLINNAIASGQETISAELTLSIDESLLLDGSVPLFDVFIGRVDENVDFGGLAEIDNESGFVKARVPFGYTQELVGRIDFSTATTNRLTLQIDYPVELFEETFTDFGNSQTGGLSITSVNQQPYIIERLVFNDIEQLCGSELRNRHLPLEFRSVYDETNFLYRAKSEDNGKQISFRVIETRASGETPRVSVIAGPQLNVLPTDPDGSITLEVIEPSNGQLYDLGFGQNFNSGSQADAVQQARTGGRSSEFFNALQWQYPQQYSKPENFIVRVPQATENSAVYLYDVNQEIAITSRFDEDLNSQVPVFKQINATDFKYTGATEDLFDLIQNNVLTLAVDPDCSEGPPEGPLPIPSGDTGDFKLIDISLEILTDVAPVVSLSDPSEQLTLSRYGSATIGLTVNDPGRNIAYIRAIAPSFGNEQLFGEYFTRTSSAECDGEPICLNELFVNNSGSVNFVYQLAEQEQLAIQLPITTNLRLGIYPIDIVAYDTTGNFTTLSTEIRVLEGQPGEDALTPPFRIVFDNVDESTELIAEFEVTEADGYSLGVIDDNSGELFGNLALDGVRVFESDSCSASSGEISFFALEIGTYTFSAGGDDPFNIDRVSLTGERTENCQTQFNDSVAPANFGIIFGFSDVDTRDSDADGLNDFEEEYIFSTSPFNSDSDGDGVSDFIEIASGSDPNNTDDAIFDPATITGVEISPNNLSALLGVDERQVQLQVIATVLFRGESRSIDITDLSGMASFISADEGIARASTAQNGLINYIGVGVTEINVAFLNDFSPSQTIPVTIDATADADLSAPSVVDVFPSELSDNIPINTTIVVRFSEPLNRESAFGTEVVQISANGGNLLGSAVPSEDGISVVFFPRANNRVLNLESDTSYTVSVQGVRDLAGNLMQQPFVTNFTTSNFIDTVRPELVNTNPLRDAVNIPVNTPVDLIFNERMDPQQFDTRNFAVRNNSTFENVPGMVQVSQDGLIASFIPDEPFDLGQRFTVILRSNIRDTSLNRIFSTSFNFTTSFEEDLSRPQILSMTPNDNAFDVPTNASIILGFSEPMNVTNTSDGIQLWVAGESIPVSISLSEGNRLATIMPQGSLIPSALHTVVLSTEITDIAGNQIENPGSFSFTTSDANDFTPPLLVDSAPSGFLISQPRIPTNTDIQLRFNEQIDPTTASFARLLVSNGFSTGISIAGSVEIDSDLTTLSITPDSPLISGQSYEVFYGGIRDLSGNLLVTNANPRIAFTVEGIDTQVPEVLVVSPQNGQTNVPINISVRVEFTEHLNIFSVTDDNVRLLSNGIPLAGGIKTPIGSNELVFTPDQALSTSTLYTLELNGLTDRAGNPLPSFSSSFTTDASAEADVTRPLLVSVEPAFGTTNIPANSSIVLTYDEMISPLIVNISDARVRVTVAGVPGSSSVNVAGSFSVIDNIVTFTPLNPFPGGALVTADILDIRDLAGNVSFSGFNSVNFTVSDAVADTTSPEVILITPMDGEQNISPNQEVVLTFNESIVPGDLNFRNIALIANGGQLTTSTTSFRRSSDNRSVTISTELPGNSVIDIVATQDVKDLMGNLLVNFSSTFTTSAADSGQPSVSMQRPRNGAFNVPLENAITLFIDRSLNPSTVIDALRVTQNGVLVTGTTNVTGNNQVVEFIPGEAWQNDALVQIFLDSNAQDFSNNGLNDYQGSFRTEGIMVNTQPEIIDRSLNSFNIATNAIIRVLFDRPLDPSTVSQNSVQLLFDGNTIVPVNIDLERDNRVISITPNEPLLPNGFYEYRFNSSILSADGQSNRSTFNFSFRAASESDFTSPTTSISLPDGVVGVGINADIKISFDESIDPLGVTQENLAILDNNGLVVASDISFSNNNSEIIITPYTALQSNTTFSISVDGIADVAGNISVPVTHQFTTSNQPDSTLPSIVRVSPTNFMSGVPVNSMVTISFSEPVLESIATSENYFRIRDRVTFQDVVGTRTLSEDGLNLAFVPDIPFPVNRNFDVFVATAITDLTGNRLSGSSSTRFTTSLLEDILALQVVAIGPPDGTSDAPRNLRLLIEFNEPPQAASVENVNIEVNEVAIPVIRRLQGTRLSITPLTLLEETTPYTVNVSGVSDLSGNMVTPVISNFTASNSALVSDTFDIESQSPVGPGIAINADIVVRFNRRINPVTVDSNTFRLSSQFGGTVSGSIVIEPTLRTIRFVPGSPLVGNTNYTVSLTTAIRDLANHDFNFGSNRSFTFTTTAFADLTPPEVTEISPQDNLVNIPLNAPIQVRFSEPLISLTNPDDVVELFQNGTDISGTSFFNGNTDLVTFTPTDSLNADTRYTVQISGEQDRVGNVLIPFISSFTTSVSGDSDITRPTLISTNPLNGEMNVDVFGTINLTFSERINPISVTSISLRLQQLSGSFPIILGSLSLSQDGLTVTFTPDVQLPPTTNYRVFLSGFQDIAGNTYAGVFTPLSFSTGL